MSATSDLQIDSLRLSSGYLKRAWDDECIVYVSGSRETHVLNAPCAHVLDLLEQGPTSFESLRSELRSQVDGASEQELADFVGQIVETLARIGLVHAQEDAS